MILFTRNVTCNEDAHYIVYSHTTQTPIRLICTTLLALALFGFVFNLLILRAIFAKKLNKKINEILQTFLVACNMIRSVLIFSRDAYYILLTFEEFADATENCDEVLIFNALGVILLNINIVIVLMMVIQLYLAVVKPFLYESTYNKRFFIPGTILLAVVFIVYHTLMFITNLNRWNYVQKSFLIIAVCACVVIFILYVQISKELSAMRRRVYQSNAAGGASNRRLIKRREAKKLVIRIIAVLILTNIPVTIFILILRKAKGLSELESTLFWLGLPAFARLGIIFDPLILLLRSKRIRKAMKSVFLGQDDEEENEHNPAS